MGNRLDRCSAFAPTEPSLPTTASLHTVWSRRVSMAVIYLDRLELRERRRSPAVRRKVCHRGVNATALRSHVGASVRRCTMHIAQKPWCEGYKPPRPWCESTIWACCGGAVQPSWPQQSEIFNGYGHLRIGTAPALEMRPKIRVGWEYCAREFSCSRSSTACQMERLA
jgi:hypothetical protein